MAYGITTVVFFYSIFIDILYKMDIFFPYGFCEKKKTFIFEISVPRYR